MVFQLSDFAARSTSPHTYAPAGAPVRCDSKHRLKNNEYFSPASPRDHHVNFATESPHHDDHDGVRHHVSDNGLPDKIRHDVIHQLTFMPILGGYALTHCGIVRIPETLKYKFQIFPG